MNWQERYRKKKIKLREERKETFTRVLCGKREAIPGMSGCDYCYSLNQEYKDMLQKERRGSRGSEVRILSPRPI